MTLDTLTGIVFLCAVAMMSASENRMIRILIVTILFQSAAAIKIGSTGITPGHLLLVIPAYRCLRDRERRATVVAMSRFPNGGFWLLLLCVYSGLSGYFNPRLMAGATIINPIGTTSYEPSLSGVPLGPSSGNMTQFIYMTGSTLAYLLISEHVVRAGGLRNIAKAMYAYCVLNVALAIVDLAGNALGLGDLLAIFHNGNYTLHLDEVQSGLKRIAGAFSEAAAFATATLGALAFTTRLCLGNIDVRFTAMLSLVQIGLLILSTSSTAYVGIPVLFLFLYIWVCSRSLIGPANPCTIAATALVPLVVIVSALTITLHTAASDTVTDLLNDIVFNKSQSSSAMERGALNTQAITNFFDTFGIGAGAGSARTSSFPLAVLANLGIPGAVPYLLFLAQAFLRPSDQRRNSVEWHVQGACRWGAFGVLVAEVFSGTLVDLGIFFFVLIAAGSAHGRRRAAAKAPAAACDGDEVEQFAALAGGGHLARR